MKTRPYRRACIALAAAFLAGHAGAAETDFELKNVRSSGTPRPPAPAAAYALDPEPAVVVELPPLDLAAVAKEDASINDARKGVRRIGVRRPLPVEVSPGAWQPTSDGGAIWMAEFAADGAVAIRVHLEAASLPRNARIVAYSPEDPSKCAGPYARADFDNGSLWTESVFASRVIVECYVASAELAAQCRFTVRELVHVYADPVREALAKVGDCHNDVTCHPAWNLEKNATAGIGSIGDVGFLWCTGCLLTDTDPSTMIDYFMTANHCVGNQNEASTTEFYWFYQTPSCDGAAPSPSSVPRTGGGADYLAGRSATFYNDFAFLRLRRESPGGAGFAGWSTQPVGGGADLTGIHHPDGDFKRISFGAQAGSDSDYWYVRWTSGVTEPGSSGSPLFNSQRRFVGQLWGGESACDYQEGLDEYGRFDVSYPRIKQWLSPQATVGAWYIRALPPAAQPLVFGVQWGSSTMRPVPGDYDGDTLSDLAVFEPASGMWYIKPAAPGSGPIVFGVNWGTASMTPVPGDYNGDGRDDLAMWNPATGQWYIRSLVHATPIAFGLNWGGGAMIPVPGDYNGDGRADLALFEPATGRWYIRSLVHASPIAFGVSWGAASMTPVSGDYNGDGRDDLALFEPATGKWFIRSLVHASPIVFGVNWGSASMTPVPGDYNADKRSDLALWDAPSGNWYIRPAGAGSAIAMGLSWGTAGMRPVSGDYNGDGIADLALFKP